jgi:hypothetical protein
VTTSVPWRPCEGISSPAPNGVEFKKHDYDNDQEVQDKPENYPRHAPEHGERPMLGPLQAATRVFEGAARGTEGTALLSNARCSRPNGSEIPHG